MTYDPSYVKDATPTTVYDEDNDFGNGFFGAGPFGVGSEAYPVTYTRE